MSRGVKRHFALTKKLQRLSIRDIFDTSDSAKISKKITNKTRKTEREGGESRKKRETLKAYNSVFFRQSNFKILT